MSENFNLDGLTAREAVEEVAHEIRSRQLSILTLVQVLRRVQTGEMDIDSLPNNLDFPQGMDSIQQNVREISNFMDILVDHVRDNDSA